MTVAPVQPSIFAPSIAPRLGIDMPSVESGGYSEMTIPGPTLTRTITLPAASLLHVRINSASFTPWRGRAPHQVARLTAGLTPEIEQHFPEPPRRRARIEARAQGHGPPVAMPRTTQAGWDGDGGGRPARDWDPRYLRLAPAREAVELRRDVETSLARAYGTPAAMLSPTVWRTVAPCAVASEADRCAGCALAGDPNHVGGLQNMARRRAGRMPGVLVTLPGGPRPTRVMGDDGRVVESLLPP